jgi:D-alanine-D-alanine ligase
VRVLVLTGDHRHPDPTKWDGRYVADDLKLHDGMRAALATLADYEFEFLVEHDRLIERLSHDPPELVLNFCDTGYRNIPTQELHLPALFELFDVAYTGGGPASLALCYDKHVVERVAEALGVPVPRSLLLSPGKLEPPREAFYPALVKPVHGDGSVGIVPESVVRTPAEAVSQLEWLGRLLPQEAVLWQEYLDGPEYGLTLLGNPGTGFTALPPVEVDYSGVPKHLPRILAFETKTGPETRYSGIRLRRARLSDAVRNQLAARAERLFVRLHCRDYARFDFRAGADGEIRLLEVNPNPAWSSAAKMAIMAGYAGMSYADLLRNILDVARARTASAPDGSQAGEQRELTPAR